MKKTLLFLAMAVIGFAACKKDDTISSPSYHVDGITDLTLVKDSRTGAGNPFLNLNVVYENSFQEHVALSLENAPVGLSYRMTTPSGIPTFSSVLSFSDSGVAEGNYALKLVAQGEYTGRKEFKFRMTVTGQPDCTADVVGNNFMTNTSCGGIPFIQNVTAVAGMRNRILFNNLDNAGTSVYATVDCENQALNIPEQVVNGATYFGWGNYFDTGTQRILQFTVQISSASGTQVCQFTLVK